MVSLAAERPTPTPIILPRPAPRRGQRADQPGQVEINTKNSSQILA